MNSPRFVKHRLHRSLIQTNAVVTMIMGFSQGTYFTYQFETPREKGRPIFFIVPR